MHKFVLINGVYIRRDSIDRIWVETVSTNSHDVKAAINGFVLTLGNFTTRTAADAELARILQDEL